MTAPSRPVFVRPLCLAVLALIGFAVMTVQVLEANGPTSLDSSTATAVLDARGALLTVVAVALSALGSFPILAVAAVGAAIALLLRTRRFLPPLTLLITATETGCIVYLTKIIVGRERPPLADLVGTPAADGSFPSGHTTNSTVVYGLAALLLAPTISRIAVRRLLYASTALLAVGIGLSRIYLGYHWTTDVLAGWLLATVVCGAARLIVGLLPSLPAGIDPLEAPSVPQPPRSAMRTSRGGGWRLCPIDPPTPSEADIVRADV